MNKRKFVCTLDNVMLLHLSMDVESEDIQTMMVNKLMFGIKIATSIWQQFIDKVHNGLEGAVCFFAISV